MDCVTIMNKILLVGWIGGGIYAILMFLLYTPFKVILEAFLLFLTLVWILVQFAVLETIKGFRRRNAYTNFKSI